MLSRHALGSEITGVFNKINVIKLAVNADAMCRADSIYHVTLMTYAIRNS